MDTKEKQIIKLLQKSPDEGMNQIMDLYAKPVLSICKHILREEEPAKDAAQETFIKLWRYVAAGKQIKTSLKAFIYQIARNSALDLLKKAGKGESFSLDAADGIFLEQLVAQTGVDLETEWARRENYRLVREVLNRMEEPEHSIFLLKYFYNYTIREIAQILGMSDAKVQSRERRGREKLRKALEERGVFDDE